MVKKKRGFTLLEIIIVLALSTLIITIVNSIFLTGNRVFTDTNLKSDLQIEGQDIQQEITNKLIGATKIKEIKKTDGEIIDFQNLDEVTKNSIINTKVNIKSVTIYVAEPDESNPDLVDENEYTFEADGNNLTCIDSEKTKILTTNLKKNDSDKPEISIKVNDNHVEFDINLYKKKGKIYKEYPIKVDVLFRNHDSNLN